MKGINSTNNYNIININKYRYNNKNCNNNICFKKKRSIIKHDDAQNNTTPNSNNASNDASNINVTPNISYTINNDTINNNNTNCNNNNDYKNNNISKNNKIMVIVGATTNNNKK